MKKTLLTICAFFFALHCIAQSDFPIDSVTKKISYSRTYKTKLKKPALYSKIREWYATQFASSKAVVQLDDKVSGKIIGKSAIDFEYPYNGDWIKYHLAFTVKVNYRDFKYKCSITDLVIRSSSFDEDTELEIYNSVIGDHPDGKAELSSLSAGLTVRLYTLIFALPEIVDKKDNF